MTENLALVEAYLTRTHGAATAQHSTANVNRVMDMFGCLDDAMSLAVVASIFPEHHESYQRKLWVLYQDVGALAFWTKLSASNRERLRLWYVERRAAQLRAMN